MRDPVFAEGGVCRAKRQAGMGNSSGQREWVCCRDPPPLQSMAGQEAKRTILIPNRDGVTWAFANSCEAFTSYVPAQVFGAMFAAQCVCA